MGYARRRTAQSDRHPCLRRHKTRQSEKGRRSARRRGRFCHRHSKSHRRRDRLRRRLLGFLLRQSPGERSIARRSVAHHSRLRLGRLRQRCDNTKRGQRKTQPAHRQHSKTAFCCSESRDDLHPVSPSDSHRNRRHDVAHHGTLLQHHSAGRGRRPSVRRTPARTHYRSAQSTCRADRLPVACQYRMGRHTGSQRPDRLRPTRRLGIALHGT